MYITYAGLAQKADRSHRVTELIMNYEKMISNFSFLINFFKIFSVSLQLRGKFFYFYTTPGTIKFIFLTFFFSEGVSIEY